MKNFHQNSDLISNSEIQKVELTLGKIWSSETADPETKNSWTEDNKAYGQCAVTAVLINDLFGGRMIYDKANFHIWNELPDGSQHDFTRTQFTDNKTFSIYKYKTKEDILYDERGVKYSLKERYEKLKKDYLDAILNNE